MPTKNNLRCFRSDILAYKELTMNAKMVLSTLLLAYYINRGEIMTRFEYFESIYGLTERKIFHAFKRLEEKGLLTTSFLWYNTKGEKCYSVKLNAAELNRLFEGCCQKKPLGYDVPKPEPDEIPVAKHPGPLTEEEEENYIRAARGTYKLHARYQG